MQVKEFNEMLLKKVKERQGCIDCPLQGFSTVGVDSSTGIVEKVDILFIGLNPGKDEVKFGLPFTGRAGKILRASIKSWSDENIKWGIINSLLCSTNNESEISDVEKAQDCCKSLIRNITKCFSPKIYIPLGQKSANLFNLKDPITKMSGKLYNDRIVPIIHPSFILRGENSDKIKLFHESLKYAFSLVQGDFK